MTRDLSRRIPAMKMDHRFFISASLMAVTGCLTLVTAHTHTTHNVCCPKRNEGNEFHVQCAWKGLTHFVWSHKENHATDPAGSDTLCLKTDNAIETKNGHSSQKNTSSKKYKVVRLDLSGNALTSFPVLSHPVLADLSHLNLSHNGVNELSRSSFDGKNLRVLDISHNRLLFLTADFTQIQLPRLEILNLSHNALPDLPRNVFQGVSGVKTLLVSNNRLASLKSSSFADLSSLEILVLDNNQIVSLPAGVFDDLRKLSILDLSSNSLETVPEFAFKELRRLQHLNLSRNKLTMLSAGSFTHLVSLQTLDLSRNRLQNIPAFVFRDLTNLNTLTLAHNEVKAISMETWKGLTSLSDLDVSHNHLTTIRKASFVIVNNVLKIRLNNNRLGRLHESSFASLQWLEHLDLSHNQLLLDVERLPVEVFSPLQNIRALYLHNNDARSEGTYPGTAFVQLSQLRSLSIDSFSHTRFGEEFSALINLKKLDLPDCKIKTLTEETFRGFRNSSVLSMRLSGCPLEVVEGCVFCGIPSLEKLTLSDRSLSMPSPWQGLKSNGKLIGPENSKLRLLNMSNTFLSLDFDSALARHTLKNLDQLEVLDLSRNNITTLNLTLSAGVKQILISRNRFQTIPVALKTLKRLRLLDIRSNNISYLTSAQRNELDRLAEHTGFALRLRDNPLACPLDDHSTEDFLQWLLVTSVRLDDGQTSGRNYPCVRSEGMMISVQEALGSGYSWWRTWPMTLFTGLIGALVAACLLFFYLGPRKQKDEASPSGDSPPTRLTFLAPAIDSFQTESQQVSCVTEELSAFGELQSLCDWMPTWSEHSSEEEREDERELDDVPLFHAVAEREPTSASDHFITRHEERAQTYKKTPIPSSPESNPVHEVAISRRAKNNQTLKEVANPSHYGASDEDEEGRTLMWESNSTCSPASSLNQRKHVAQDSNPRLSQPMTQTEAYMSDHFISLHQKWAQTYKKTPILSSPELNPVHEVAMSRQAKDIPTLKEVANPSHYGTSDEEEEDRTLMWEIKLQL